MSSFSASDELETGHKEVEQVWSRNVNRVLVVFPVVTK